MAAEAGLEAKSRVQRLGSWWRRGKREREREGVREVGGEIGERRPNVNLPG